MSANINAPGPSRIKRKNSDPDLGHGESKHVAEDRSITLPVCDVKGQEQEYVRKSTLSSIFLKCIHDVCVDLYFVLGQCNKTW